MPFINPDYITLTARCCPVCGIDVLASGEWCSSGHYRSEVFGDEVHIASVSCEGHFKERGESLTQDESNIDSGYVGEWEPRLGLSAKSWLGNDEYEFITIV